MFAGKPVPSREVADCLAHRLTSIYPLEVRYFAGTAAGHIRAALLDLAWGADTEPASDEIREWVRVHRGVDGLPERERELFDLLLYWGMKGAEVAALLGVPLARVRFRSWEGRVALHQSIRGEALSGR
jgi:DNA-directed RNA polymerase specialized sigma24 family protein